MSPSVAELRRTYTRAGLAEADAAADPMLQFHTWFEQALAAELPEPNAMTLATVDAAGRPSARIVLLKGYGAADGGGFSFYTNYTSRKGRDLATNPQAALVFWWAELERQVRIAGRCERLAPPESDAYFHSRPRASQLGAWASPQSQAIASRQVLDANFALLQEQYAEDETIPRPPHWGGFRLLPDEFEFWQGRPSRLHDRLRYRWREERWQCERLAP